MFAGMSQICRRFAVALVCLSAAAPVAALAQKAHQHQKTHVATTAEAYGGAPQVSEPQIEYVLPSADAWQLTKPEVTVGTPDVDAPRAPIAGGLDGEFTDKPLSPEDMAIINKALALDAAKLAGNGPRKSLHMPGYTKTGPRKLYVSATDQPDGSGNVSIKKPLPLEWDANVGADLGLAAAPKPAYGSDRLLGPTNDAAGSGAAWASLNVPHIATVDARVDPAADQGRVGTTFERSLPIGNKLAVKLRGSYSLTETLAQPQLPDETPASQIWGHEDVATLDILPTGTTLGAGVSSTSIDPITHNTLSAAQKIYGPLHVTTAVTDVGQTTESKSLSAGFKVNW
jgi:hypothetical protein